MPAHGADTKLDLATLLRAGNLPTSYVGVDGEILMVNDAGAGILGLEPAQLIGRSVYEVLPDMADLLRERIATVVADGADSFEDVVPLGGGLRVFRSIDAPMYDDSGSCIGVQIVAIDITEDHAARSGLREVEEKLDEAHAEIARRERRFTEAMNAVRDGVWHWNLETLEYWLSPNFYALVGYDEAEIDEGRREWFFGILHPDDVPVLTQRMEDHFSGKSSEYVTEFRFRHKNGNWHWALSRGKIVERKPDGTPLRMTGTTIDITEQKELEFRLLASEKMEAIGRLAGGIAHDFNNLLTAVMTRMEFLRSGELPERARRDLDQIGEAVERASKLTGQLLSFARRRMIQPRSVDVNELITELATLLSGLLGTIHLELDFEETLPAAFIDPTQLEQIIINLAINARDAMPDGGTLTIETHKVDLDADGCDDDMEPGRFIRIRVTDTGIGMGPETMTHVFEPFFTTKPVGEGTGLGLASCYGIVKQARGRISIASQPGDGTTFEIDLPESRAPEPVGIIRPSQRERQPVILVVDDENLVRGAVVRTIERLGARIFQAASGEQALALAFEADGIDLLVTDVVMPQMTGDILARRLLERHPAMKVLFISGFAEPGSLDTGAFLAKPFKPRALLDVIKSLVPELTERNRQ